MQHFGLTLELKDDPELIAQYKAYHADPLARAASGALARSASPT